MDKKNLFLKTFTILFFCWIGRLAGGAFTASIRGAITVVLSGAAVGYLYLKSTWHIQNPSISARTAIGTLYAAIAGILIGTTARLSFGGFESIKEFSVGWILIPTIICLIIGFILSARIARASRGDIKSTPSFIKGGDVFVISIFVGIILVSTSISSWESSQINDQIKLAKNFSEKEILPLISACYNNITNTSVSIAVEEEKFFIAVDVKLKNKDTPYLLKWIEPDYNCNPPMFQFQVPGNKARGDAGVFICTDDCPNKNTQYSAARITYRWSNDELKTGFWEEDRRYAWLNTNTSRKMKKIWKEKGY